MKELDKLTKNSFPDLSKQKSENTAFSRYKDPAYIADQMKNLITISLTHCPNLVHKIEENSAESTFLKTNFGIDYPYKATVDDIQLPETAIRPAPVRNTIMHSFNHASALGDARIDPEAFKNIDNLHKISTITRDIIGNKYSEFNQILDDLFPNWKEDEHSLTLEKNSKDALAEP